MNMTPSLKHAIFLSLIVLLAASCNGKDSDLPPAVDYIKSVEVKNKQTGDIKVDNFARFIEIEIDKNETKNNVIVSLVLAEGVSMVSPATTEAEYNLENKATIRLSSANREINFTMSAKDYDSGTEPPDPPDPIVTAKPRFIWIDSGGNFRDFANSKENIKRDLILAKSAGFTDIVVCVRPISGDVLFETDLADQVKWLGAWVGSNYTRIERTATWDYLQAFIDAGHELGLKVHAAINTMTGGHISTLGRSGLMYNDDSKRNWATQIVTESGIVSIMDIQSTNDYTAKFFNPANDDVQEYLCKLLEDLAAYPLDGIILDRCRYDDIESDFSNDTRVKFENYIGRTLVNWPDDAMRHDITSWGALPSNLPPYFKQMLEFRAKVIHDFMIKAKTRIKAKNPDISYGQYVGGWYGSLYGVGLNWASKKYNTSANYSWATAKYSDYGYAEQMDFLLIGAYASPISIYGTTEWTVQGFCALAKDKVRGDTPVIGGPDVGNGDWGRMDINIVNNAITQSVDAAINAGDGYFLFDMVHLKNKNQWQYVKTGIDNYLNSIKK
jgi:uncharacterized lipoprotein YddW (UPF0748 family)